MIGLDQFKVKVIKEDDDYSHIEIGPFPSGYGHTIGNSLRRLLLSSIPGAGVVGVKIEGVKHEYTSLAGLKEDVLEIVLNLKQLAVISHSDEMQVLKLEAKGDSKDEATEVTASDIETTGEVEIKNKDLLITTLADEKSDIKAEIYVNTGVGFSMPDESLRKEIGMIPIDTVFSPVKRVSLKVKPARVGQETELDKISLEIYTNGTTPGTEALLKASEIYDEVANRLVNQLGGDALLAEEELKEEEQVEEEEEQPILVSELGLSTRLTNSLLNAGVTDITELDGKTESEILEFKGMGKKSLDELKETMEENDLTLVD
jgi:DNA-directed RNA polymerase subunit alpha